MVPEPGGAGLRDRAWDAMLNFIKPYIRPYTLIARVAAAKLVDALVSFTRVPEPGSGRVLVVRLDAIGDYILWLNAARALRRIYPKGPCHVTLLANRTWSALAEREDCFDTVWEFDRPAFFNNPFYRFRLLLRIRRAGFGVAVQPTYSREYYYGDSVVRISDAPVRIGSEGDPARMSPRNKPVRDAWFTVLVPADSRPMMELERNAEFMRGLGLEDFRATMPEFAPAPGRPPVPDGYYVIFPGASADSKRWPLPRFEEVARRIYAETGLTAVICGGKREKKLARQLEHGAEIPVVNLSGKTSLDELAALIAGARFLLANDSSAVHMAAASSTPSVCITGGAHYGRFVPYRVEAGGIDAPPVPVVHEMDCFGCEWACKHRPKDGEPAPCIAGIGVDKVWECVRDLL